MQEEKIITHSAKETQDVAIKLAQQILQQKSNNSAVVLALHGDLGAGKTTFLQGFAKGLGVGEVVNSPTFLIFKKFKIKRNKKQDTITKPFENFYHVDCYRLNDAEEILPLDFKEIIKNPQNIVAIEWAEKIAVLLPKDVTQINFNHLEGDTREIILH